MRSLPWWLDNNLEYIGIVATTSRSQYEYLGFWEQLYQCPHLFLCQVDLQDYKVVLGTESGIRYEIRISKNIGMTSIWTAYPCNHEPEQSGPTDDPGSSPCLVPLPAWEMFTAAQSQERSLFEHPSFYPTLPEATSRDGVLQRVHLRPLSPPCRRPQT